MTVDEYRKYKNKELKYTKFKDVYNFWNTNPTEAQEYYRSRITRFALTCGILVGISIGFIIGVLIL